MSDTTASPAASLRRVMLFTGVMFALLTFLSIGTEIINIMSAARGFNPVFGITVLVGFVLFCGVMIGVPVWFVPIRSQLLTLADANDEVTVAVYRAALARWLSKNPILERVRVVMLCENHIVVTLKRLDVLNFRYV